MKFIKFACGHNGSDAISEALRIMDPSISEEEGDEIGRNVRDDCHHHLRTDKKLIEILETHNVDEITDLHCLEILDLPDNVTDLTTMVDSYGMSELGEWREDVLFIVDGKIHYDYEL